MLGLGLSTYKNTVVGVISIHAIASKYGSLHAWAAEDIDIVGTTTTLNDFGSIGGLDMANTTAGAQPIYNASDADFNGKSSIERVSQSSGGFLENSNSFRHSDTSGVLTVVTKTIVPHNHFLPRMFSYTTGNIAREKRNDDGGYYISYDSAVQEVSGDNILARKDVLSFFHDGVNIKIAINGAIVPHTGGSDWWFSDFLATDIGLLAFQSDNNGGYQKQALCSYSVFSTEANVLSYQTELKNYYGIV